MTELRVIASSFFGSKLVTITVLKFTSERVELVGGRFDLFTPVSSWNLAALKNVLNVKRREGLVQTSGCDGALGRE